MERIRETPIRPDELLAAVADAGHGAVDLFLGVVRDHNEGKPVRAVTYDAFRPLAEKVLAGILEEAQAQFGARAAAAHRLGTLTVGDVSLAVAASAPHRQAALACTRWVVEEAKHRLPVWKKEHYADGAAAWLEGCALEAGR